MLKRANLQDRWLLSYADFITLLFATFVLMYAVARSKEQRRPAPQPVKVPACAPAAVAPPAVATLPSPPPQPVAPPSNLLTDLRETLSAEQQNGTVAISTEQRGIIISLDDQMCFRAGQSDMQAAAVPMFEKIAGTLSRYDKRILLEGHTDSVPIHNRQFRSNWELSTARSIAVLELMERAAHIPADHFLIGGSADNGPLSSNATEQGRARNRRVDIVVLDESGVPPSHPVAAAAAVSGPLQ